MFITMGPARCSIAYAIWILARLGMVGGQVLTPSNDTSRLQSGNELQMLLKITQNGMPIVTQVSPLTAKAGLNQTRSVYEDIYISGPLVPTDSHTVDSLSDTDIAFLPCLNPDYNGGASGPSAVFATALARKPAAIVLYDRQAVYCQYHPPADAAVVDQFVFTIITPSASAQLETTLKAAHPTTRQASISLNAGATTANNTANNNDTLPTGGSGSGTVLGSSPTTAVAMIILYSITGVITALFVIIIITGAIRAHRHPDRYGPRIGGNGRARQSRAKGIARAMLDTLPIVKFGEREEPKPARDVELGATHPLPEPNPDSAEMTSPATAAEGTDQAGTAAEIRESTVPSSSSSSPPPVDDQVRETNPEPVAEGLSGDETTAATAPIAPLAEGTLGCSICTEDFVKGEDVRVLPCDHKYHPECIDPWLLNVSGTCPLCRIDLRPATSTAGPVDNGTGSISSINDSSYYMDEPPLAGSRRNRHHSGHIETVEASGGEGEGDGSRSARVSRFLDLHLGLTPNSEPEERIAALLRLRDERRYDRHGNRYSGHHHHNHHYHHHRRSRRSQSSSRPNSGIFVGSGGNVGGGNADVGGNEVGTSHRPRSGISNFIRDPFRRSVRMNNASGTEGSGTTTTTTTTNDQEVVGEGIVHPTTTTTINTTAVGGTTVIGGGHVGSSPVEEVDENPLTIQPHSPPSSVINTATATPAASAVAAETFTDPNANMNPATMTILPNINSTLGETNHHSQQHQKEN